MPTELPTSSTSVAGVAPGTNATDVRFALKSLSDTSSQRQPRERFAPTAAVVHEFGLRLKMPTSVAAYAIWKSRGSSTMSRTSPAPRIVSVAHGPTAAQAAVVGWRTQTLLPSAA